jgi:hypothetical protein
MRPRLRWASAGLLVCALAACTSQTKPPPVSSRGPVTYSSQLSIGRLLLLAGPDGGSANIYEWTGGVPNLKALTHNPSQRGISWMSASKAGIVDASALSGGDVIEFRPWTGRISRLKDKPRTRYFSPSISSTGAVAYAALRYRSVGAPVPQYFTLQAQAVPFGKPGVEVYRQRLPDVGAPTWGPAGSVAFLTPTGAVRPGQTQFIHFLTRKGSNQKIASPVQGLTQLNWSDASPWLSGTDSRGRSVFYNSVSRAVRYIAPGWNSLCWEPGSKAVLVAKGSEVGRVTLRFPAAVQPLVNLGDRVVFQCSWLADAP